MNYKIARTTVVFIALAMAVPSLVPPAYAGQCSQEGVAGTYGVSDSGTIINIGPRAAVGLVSISAAGEVHGQVTASLDGGISETTLSGKYTVNPNCMGATSFDEFDQAGNLVLTATVTLVWDDDMRELRFLFTSVVLANGTSLPVTVNGEARKLAAKEQ